MKTPEQMAEEYRENHDECEFACDAFLAGYQAAKDEDKAKMQELEANWKFCCEDKARLLNELAVAERAKDQLADTDKVMPQWISVKDRLPELGTWVLIDGPSICQRIDPPSANWKGKYAWATDHESFYDPKDVTHWMPLPEAPKED